MQGYSLSVSVMRQKSLRSVGVCKLPVCPPFLVMVSWIVFIWGKFSHRVGFPYAGKRHWYFQCLYRCARNERKRPRDVNSPQIFLSRNHNKKSAALPPCFFAGRSLRIFLPRFSPFYRFTAPVEPFLRPSLIT